jgi:hypothetical protein
MVYSLLVITALKWSIKESIQDFKIFFRRDSGFVQHCASADSQGHGISESSKMPEIYQYFLMSEEALAAAELGVSTL